MQSVMMEYSVFLNRHIVTDFKECKNGSDEEPDICRGIVYVVVL